MKKQYDLVYAEKGGKELRFDVIRPDDDKTLPLVILIHGGGWISGDKESFREEAEWIAQQGFAAATVEYRLAPLFPFPSAVADIQDFVTHIRGRAAEFGIDPNRIYSLGNSAGGHLSLMAGYTKKHAETGHDFQGVNGVVNICGISDLRIPRESHFDIAFSFLEEFMDGPYTGNEEKWEAASPVVHTGSSTPRTLSIHGDQDDVVPVQLSQNLDLVLKDLGVESELVVLGGEGHSFTYEGWDTIRQHYVKFLGA